MSTVEIRQKLHDYIETAPDKKVEAIFTILEDEIEEEVYDHWEDKEFVAELMEERERYLNGTDRTYSQEEVDQMMRETIQSVRHSSAHS